MKRAVGLIRVASSLIRNGFISNYVISWSVDGQNWMHGTLDECFCHFEPHWTHTLETTGNYAFLKPFVYLYRSERGFLFPKNTSIYNLILHNLGFCYLEMRYRMRPIESTHDFNSSITASIGNMRVMLYIIYVTHTTNRIYVWGHRINSLFIALIALFSRYD